MSAAELLRDCRRFYQRINRGSHSSILANRSAYPTPQALLARAREYFSAPDEACEPLAGLIAAKLEPARAFDIGAVQRAVAICTCGSSGSLLLASYLDGHDDVIATPELFSQGIYPYFDAYPSLSLREKLIGYPFYSADSRTRFEGMFTTRGGRSGSRHYAAAVEALLQANALQPVAVLETPRTFFVMLHLAYSLALDRPPGTRSPLLVYAQHIWDVELSRRFVSDFPKAKFIHTVRDPISNWGRHLARFQGKVMGAALLVSHLTYADIPHSGMVERSRAIRFEDLHTRLEPTLRALAAWLELPFAPVLLTSTMNGEPWVVTSGGKTWSGARPEQAVRDSGNVPRRDRALLYAVLREDFAAWDYPCPTAFARPALRLLTCLTLVLLPMRIELITLQAFWRTRHGQGLRYTLRGIGRLVLARMAIALLLVLELGRRLLRPKAVVERLPVLELPAS